MECYEGATMIKSFRGLIADEGIDTIVLHTNDGSIGYRIVKLNVIGDTPGGPAGFESVIQIWKVPQTTTTSTIDFSDNTLLGVGLWSSSSDTKSYPDDQIVIFDGEIFNQDIYITHDAGAGQSGNCNYYLELEQVKLDLNQNTVATLKDIRNVTAP